MTRDGFAIIRASGEKNETSGHQCYPSPWEGLWCGKRERERGNTAPLPPLGAMWSHSFVKWDNQNQTRNIFRRYQVNKIFSIRPTLGNRGSSLFFPLSEEMHRYCIVHGFACAMQQTNLPQLSSMQGTCNQQETWFELLAIGSSHSNLILNFLQVTMTLYYISMDAYEIFLFV